MKISYPEIISENSFNTVFPQVLEGLEKIREVSLIDDGAGGTLYCESYLSENPKANIVILHGFTEFSEKYREMIHYYLQLSFNVFIYDQRGHGFSHREIEDLKLIHINDFNDYVKDLDTVIEKLVRVKADKLPIYLFSHSMGGAVTGLYLMKYPNKIKKAILSSPMISPHTIGVPRRPVIFISKYHGRKSGFESRFPYTSDFDPQVSFEMVQDSSRARFQYTMKLRLQTEEYRSSTATNRWMLEAVTVQDKLLKRKQLKKIETEVLIVSAKNDRVVKNRYQKKFASMLKNCRFETIENVKHNIFFANEPMLSYYYSVLFDFFTS